MKFCKMSRDLEVIKLAKSLFQDESDGLSATPESGGPETGVAAVRETEAS